MHSAVWKCKFMLITCLILCNLQEVTPRQLSGSSKWFWHKSGKCISGKVKKLAKLAQKSKISVHVHTRIIRQPTVHGSSFNQESYNISIFAALLFFWLFMLILNQHVQYLKIAEQRSNCEQFLAFSGCYLSALKHCDQSTNSE